MLFLWSGLNFELTRFSNDPNYVYLVNATAICDGKNVGYIDHPGTTVIQIGALTIALKHWISNPENESLVRHVLTDPHAFIVSIRNVLLILNTLVLLLLGFVALKKTKSVWAALLLQATTFISTNALDHAWSKVSPEPFLFFITCIFVITILYFYSEKEKNSWKYVFLFILISGAGLGTKATFLPLIILPLIILPTIKKKIVYIAGIIPSFVLFTIPIIPEYKHMYYWFRDLINYSGIYGHGDKGFIDLKTYLPNILKIIKNNIGFSLIVATGAIIILISIVKAYTMKKTMGWDHRILGGLVASSVFGVLLVAKHYHVNHYLIPILLLSGILLFFILKIIINDKSPTIIKKYALPVIVIFIVLLLSWRQPPILRKANKNYTISNEEMDSTRLMIERDYHDYSIINYYTFSLNKFTALKFGDVYTKQRMLPYLKKIYPDTYFYDHSKRQIQHWNTEVDLNDFIDKWGNKILIVNGPKKETTVEEMRSVGIPLINIYKGLIWENLMMLEMMIKYIEDI